MRCIALVAIALLLSPLSIRAESLPELIVPVNESELDQVRTNNDYFLRRQLYFSKRHRIVKVNDTLLNGTPRFRITLFDDVIATIETKEVTQVRADYIRWRGMIVVPGAIEVRNQAGELQSDQVAQETRERILGVNFSALTWDLDRATGKASLAMYRPSSTSPHPIAANEQQSTELARLSQLDKNAFRSVRGSLRMPVTNSRFWLMPVDADPQYHLLYEENPERTGFMRIDTPYDETTTRGARDKQKYEQYQEFLRSLGEDPKARPTGNPQ